ncbi:TPA: quinone-dependent dihydroorotate dehydrogenase [Candidatus Taylorbacteria bacterium]|nr:quinone-dependent dihydroorotate dehydrogenase [Candidatus Taylorbacteria bacterium]
MKTSIKNNVLYWSYTHVLKPVFFRQDPETVHDHMVGVGKMLGKYKLAQKVTRSLFAYRDPMLEQIVLGLKFKNPIGLAAGFDKNAELVDILPSVGFGFVEVGSITGYPCEGNPKPRLWRLPKSKGLVVYYGLKNEGCDAIAERLQNRIFDNVVGTSVAMTNCAANLDTETAIKDYAKAFTALSDIGDYFTINISCPNAQGGQPFVDHEKLDALLNTIDQIQTKKPIFIKLSPDLETTEIDNILNVVAKHRIHGIICTNLTKPRSNLKIVDNNVPEQGGVSGKPVQELSDKLLAYIYKKTKGQYVLVGCGGVFNAEDAYKKIRLGASLVQLATGMIFEGPQLIGEINRGLVQLLKRDGFKNISEAVGVDNHQIQK